MEEDNLLLTQRDRDVLKVLHEVRRGHITQREAAEQLKRTDRWIRTLVARIQDKGDRAIIHGLRGQPSTHRIAEKIEKKAVTILEREYADFGPTLASEYLARDHKITVSRETVRQWMLRAGLWKRRKQRLEEVHVWRARRSCFGELVQWDTSDHDWLEGRVERIYLIAMIDDATSRALARFAPQDSTAENMRLVWAWLAKYGRFVDGYTDRAGLFETNRPNQRDEERDGKLPETQIGRALRELGIGRISALSPQAKGRIERFFKTAQDRMVKGMRKKKVSTMEAANAYLEEEYLPMWNERFTVRPAREVDAHRPMGKEHDLGSILGHVEQRVMGQDYTIRYGGRLYQLTSEQIGPGLKQQTVRVEQRLDGRLVVPWRGQPLEVRACEQARPAHRTPPRASGAVGKKRNQGGNHGWMKGFHLHGGPSLEEVVAHACGEPWEEESE